MTWLKNIVKLTPAAEAACNADPKADQRYCDSIPYIYKYVSLRPSHTQSNTHTHTHTHARARAQYFACVYGCLLKKSTPCTHPNSDRVMCICRGRPVKNANISDKSRHSSLCVRYIKTPLFVTESASDKYQVEHQVRIAKMTDQSPFSFSLSSKC
jgi:hypothetical protein